MKTAAFQLIATGVSLGIMGGAVGIHWLHLAGAGSVSGPEPHEARRFPPEISSASLRADPAEKRLEAQATPAGELPAANAENRATLAVLSEITSRLEELKGDQDHLREQLLEANRDLNVLEFRVDSHSESFRPIPSSGAGSIRGRSVSPGHKVQPFARGFAGHPLLPPKEP